MDNQYTPERMEAMEMVNKAQLLVNIGNYAAAKPLLADAIRIDPMYVEAYVQQGSFYLLQEKFTDALSSFENALLVDKNKAEVYFHIGNVHLLQDHFSDAVAAFAKAEELGHTSQALVENLAFCYEQLDENGAALSAYTRASLFNPDDPHPRIARISIQMKSGSYDAAKNALEDFILRFPQIAEGYEMMTDVLLQQRELGEAEIFLSNALEAFPGSYALLLQKARVFALAQRPDEALEAIALARLQEGVDEAITDVLDEYEANICIMKNDVDGAIALYQRIISNEKGSTNAPARVAYLNLLNGARRFEELLKATASALKTPEAESSLCMAYALEPFALENLGRLEEAVPLYRNAINKLRRITIEDGTRLDTYMYRSLCYRGLKEYQKALDQLTIYDDMRIESAEICQFKAQLYKEMGNLEGEKAELERMNRLKQDEAE